jgi:hypothetical protein
MTRVLIIGSSHVAAYKYAADAFRAEFPEVELAYFGVRGPLFLTGTMDQRGIFTPGCRDEADKEAVRATNGSPVADASGFDHLLLVGHRFAFLNFASLLEHHDVLEGIRTGKRHLISEAMLTEIIETATEDAVTEAAGGFGPWKKSLTFAPAPYPAQSIVERGDSFEMARVLGLFWARPDAAWIFDLALGALHAAMNKRGYGFLEQPAALNAGPFATKPEFAKRAAAMDSGLLGKTDHRHMNADYGLAMLRSFAKTRLGLTPTKNGQAKPSNTVKERIA